MFFAYAGPIHTGYFGGVVAIIPLAICACLAIAGGMMLFFPDRAFRSEWKPRWIGLPLLCIGLAGAIQFLEVLF